MKTILALLLLTAFAINAATVVPTPVGRHPGALGPGVIVARSAPGYLPSGMTLIKGRDQFGIATEIFTRDQSISWSWRAGQLWIFHDTTYAIFSIIPPYPGWKFAMTVSGGGPEPIWAGTSVGGPLITMTSAGTLLLPELYANGAIVLPATSSRHVLWRYEIIR